MATNNPEQFHVGDKLKVKLYDGRVVDATIRAVVEELGKLRIDFGNEETAVVDESQIMD